MRIQINSNETLVIQHGDAAIRVTALDGDLVVTTENRANSPGYSGNITLQKDSVVVFPGC